MTIFSLRRHSKGLGLSPRRSASTGSPPGDTVAPSIPQDLVALAVSSSQINLTWDASTDNVAVTGYQVYRDNVLIATSPTNSFSDTGLAPGTLFQYEVSAFDAASNVSARSAPASATTHQVIVTAGRIAEWRFDNGSGQVLTDYSGNGHHGQLGTTSGADAADPTWTAEGLSFGGNNTVDLPSIPGVLGIDIVFKPDSAIHKNTARTALIGHADALSNGIILGSFTGTLGNEIVAVAQQSAQGYSGDHRRAYTHANDTISAAWHLLQVDWQGGSPYYNLVLDGTDIANATVGTPQQWLTNQWSLGSRQGPGVADGFTGDIAYVLFYSIGRSSAQQAQNRQALTAILASRGITLP